jgi:acetyltransferase-like isoleucine patch superfamily enzyme
MLGKKSNLKYTLLNIVWRQIKLNRFQRKWNKHNPHNCTIPMRVFPKEVVNVGNNSYGELNIITYNNKTHLNIGNFVSIAENVSFLLDVEHHIDCVSTYPFMEKIIDSNRIEAFSKGDIIVDDDVWIGYGATILSGVHIGQGAVIAAGAVVVKDVPACAIVGGVPAKIIRYRFNKEIADGVREISFSRISDSDVRKYISEFSTPVVCDNYRKIVDVLTKK